MAHCFTLTVSRECGTVGAFVAYVHVPSAVIGVCSCCMCNQLKQVPRLAAQHSFGAVVCGGNRAPYSCFGLCCVDVLGFRAGHRSACSFCSLACSWARLLAFACVVACALGLLALRLACLPACLLACGLAACSHSVGGVVSFHNSRLSGSHVSSSAVCCVYS